MRVSRSSWFEIDLSAIRRNIGKVQGLAGDGCRILAVVKSNAYGHGLCQAAGAALEGGAWGLCVADVQEASRLRRAGIDAPILLLNSGRPEEAGKVVRLGLIQALYSRQMAKALSRAAQRSGSEAEAHIKIDTGMNRLGVGTEEAEEFAAEVAALPNLRISGIFSHLATAEEEDSSYALRQFEFFRSSRERVSRHLPGLKAHIANSAATLKFPQMRLDFVRVGLLAYGVSPLVEAKSGIELEPALTWKTRIAFVRRIPSGATVSYGRTWRALCPTTLAVLPVGYADGYSRALSNRGQVLLRGGLRPVVGTVCMNHMMIDANEETGIRPGEEVVLIGRQGDQRITANHLAERGQTVPHEILARLGSDVRRVYLP